MESTLAKLQNLRKWKSYLLRSVFIRAGIVGSAVTCLCLYTVYTERNIGYFFILLLLIFKGWFHGRSQFLVQKAGAKYFEQKIGKSKILDLEISSDIGTRTYIHVPGVSSLTYSSAQYFHYEVSSWFVQIREYIKRVYRMWNIFFWDFTVNMNKFYIFFHKSFKAIVGFCK